MRTRPVAGAPVTFAASPGVQLSARRAVTDAAGQAEVSVRLPVAEGVAAVTVNAPSIAQAPVTFFVRCGGLDACELPEAGAGGRHAARATGPRPSRRKARCSRRSRRFCAITRIAASCALRTGRRIPRR